MTKTPSPKDRLVGQDFEGLVAVVAGGAGGIGGVICDALAGQRAQVASLDLTKRGSGLSLRVDLTDEGQIAEAIATVEEKLGSIQLLVYSAATQVEESAVSEMSIQLWEEMLGPSLTGAFLTFRRVVPSMAAAGYGKVVAISSGFGRKGYRNGAHYAAAKGGLESLVKSLALEVAESNITLNAVAPGPVSGPRIAHLESERDRWEATLERIPMGRVASPDDVTAAVMFLLSSQSDYITGQVIHVNGGMLMP